MAEYLFNRCFIDPDTEGIHDCISCCGHALADTELFCPATALHGLFVVDIQNVHSTVPDICQKICPSEIFETADNGRVSLGIQAASGQADVILFFVEPIGYFRITEQIASEFFPLSADPCEWKSGRKMNVCFPDAVQVQLPCHSHQREQVIVLIRSFVRDKFLVAVPNPIVHPAVFQDVAGEDRFGLIGCHAAFCDSTGGLNIAVAVIHADDHEIFKFFHASLHLPDLSFCS